MGYGSYSHDAHVAISRSRQDSSREEVFKQRACHPLMNPQGLKFRESRDSQTHPNSVSIVFALDVTGSMGKIPEQLARQHLPNFMKTILDAGVNDPQILFLAVGDATCDKAPLQVGQFESAAQEMDQWLTLSFLEGGGGGQNTESYELAVYVAAYHTKIDCWEKRQRRGYFFMTGDELPYPVISRSQVRQLIGSDIDRDIPIAAAMSTLSEKYEPFFLIPDAGRATRVERYWRDLLGDHVICMDSPEDTCSVAAAIMALNEKAVPDLDAIARNLRNNPETSKRVGPIIRAITPFASTLGMDAVPAPSTSPAQAPNNHGRKDR